MANPRASETTLHHFSPSDHWRNQKVPLTAVLITYNQIRVVEQALQSVLAQTYPLQLIVSDDASRDGTAAMLHGLLEHYRGPHAVTLRTSRRNLGVVGNQNAALSLAEGELIMLCEGDDVSQSERADRLVQRYLELDRTVGALGSSIRIISEQGEPRRVVSWPRLRGDAATLARHAWPVHGCTLALRRDCISDFGSITHGLISGDIAMWVRAAFLERGGLAQVPEPLVDYRMHAENVSSGFTLDYTSVADLRKSCQRLCRNEVAQVIELKKVARYRSRLGKSDAGLDQAWQQLFREARARAQLVLAIVHRPRSHWVKPAITAMREPGLRSLAVNALLLAYAPMLLKAYRQVRSGRLRSFGD
jgi:glycosyltransferase involved in cell wall biosynthesis